MIEVDTRMGARTPGGGIDEHTTLKQNESANQTHTRSSSCYVPVCKSTEPTGYRNSVALPASGVLIGNYLPRSKSAQILRTVPEEAVEEHLASMAQLMWIAVTLLESDQEHEFHLAAHLLHKLCGLVDIERADCFERLGRMLRQLNWPLFPGIVAMLCKGCVFPYVYEQTVGVLANMIDLLDHSVVDAG
jgi:hypothetical protein